MSQQMVLDQKLSAAPIVPSSMDVPCHLSSLKCRRLVTGRLLDFCRPSSGRDASRQVTEK